MPRKTTKHIGNELALMLSGAKPMAHFPFGPDMDESWVGDDGFAPYVESGQILKFVEYYWDGTFEQRYYCLPNEVWRYKLLHLVASLSESERKRIFTTQDLHRMDGILLGYDPKDVDAFVERVMGGV